MEQPRPCAAARSRAALSGDRSVRTGRARLAGEPGVAGPDPARAGQLLAEDRSVQPTNTHPRKENEELCPSRSARALADEHSGHRTVLGAGAAGRDRAHRTLCHQATTVKLRRTDAAPATIGGPETFRGDCSRGLAPTAVDSGGGGDGSRPLLSRGPTIRSAPGTAQTPHHCPRGAGP